MIQFELFSPPLPPSAPSFFPPSVKRREGRWRHCLPLPEHHSYTGNGKYTGHVSSSLTQWLTFLEYD